MAEKEGFEPSIRFKTYIPLAGERLQPLGHLSVTWVREGFDPRFDVKIARLVERNLAKVEVASSDLVSRSHSEIGRYKGLKIPRHKHHASSSPAPGTNSVLSALALARYWIRSSTFALPDFAPYP